MDIPRRPPPLALRRTNTEIPLTSKGRPSPTLGGAAAGAYSFLKRVSQTRPSVRSNYLLVPPLGPAVSDEKYVFR